MKVGYAPGQHTYMNRKSNTTISISIVIIAAFCFLQIDDVVDQQLLLPAADEAFQPSNGYAGPSNKRLSHGSLDQDTFGSSLRVKKEPLPKSPDIFFLCKQMDLRC